MGWPPGALTRNENVQDGKANGSQAIFQKVVLKPEVVPRQVFIAPNVSVNSIFAREVAHVVLKHCNNRVQPSIFILESKRFSFKARILKPGVDALFVHSWHYATNWVYVILSRVKTMKGLYLRMKLSGDLKKYRLPGALTRMLQHFRDRAPTYWSVTMIMTVCLIQFERSIARESMNDRQHWHGVVDC